MTIPGRSRDKEMIGRPKIDLMGGGEVGKQWSERVERLGEGERGRMWRESERWCRARAQRDWPQSTSAALLCH